MSDYEIIAVENGSTDGSLPLLRETATKDSRIRVVLQEHADLVLALNTGISHCTGQFIARMDADDRCHPYRLEWQTDILADCDVCGTGVLVFNASGVKEGYRKYETWVNGLLEHEDMLRERFIESPIPHPTAMFRRAWIEQMGGYRDCGWPEDYDLWLRAFESGARFAKRPEALYLWRDEPERLSRTHAMYTDGAFLRCKAHFLARALRGELRPVALWGAGPVGKRLLRCLLAEGITPHVVIDIDPKKIGRTRQGIPVAAANILETAAHFVLTAAIREGARAEIRAALGAMRYREGVDYFCCA